MLFSQWSPRLRCKYDLHDYCDGDLGGPYHMVTHRCVRCGKEFQI